MIVTHIMGGLGNQLFQYAFGRYLAHKHNTELKLEIFTCEAFKLSHHAYYKLGDFNIVENIATLDDLKNVQRIDEKEVPVENVSNLPDNVFLYGYWGSEKYFIEIRDILLKELTLKNPLGNVSTYWQQKILSAKNPVSIHVRCGDFFTPLCRNSGGSTPIDCYFDCVNKLKEIYPDLELFIFSDDLDYVKKFFKFDVPTNFVEGCEKDCDEIYLISICKHNINASNSTFSWWGAWLNQNPDKKIFSPVSSYTNSKFIPDTWIKIPVDSKKKSFNIFPPFVSIVIYVENNLDSMQFSMPSFFNQNFDFNDFNRNFDDYEIIIVDNGTNNFCRQFAVDEKVTYLKVEESVGKYEAWNRGLENACGENILFVTSKSFISPNALRSLAQLFYDYLVIIQPQGKYLNYANYNETFPDIICSTQMFEENISGDVDIGIPNKKFSLRVDEPFKNLNTLAEMKIEDSQKLIALGTRQINNLLSTKFFKRKFLLENKIRFCENNQGGGGYYSLLKVS